MMRLSSNLRRFRWLVFSCWLLALVPAIVVALVGSHNLTGSGFDVPGSQSLYVDQELQKNFAEQGATPLALVAAPRADATYADMNAAVNQLRQVAERVPSVTVISNPASSGPQPDRPYVVSLRLDYNNTGAVDVATQLREAIGITGDRPGYTDNGRVRLYVVGQGALGAAAQISTKHDIAEAERWNLPIVLIVLLLVFGSLAAAAIPLALALCTVTVTMGIVYWLSTVTTMSVFVTSTVSMFGIALAVDYSLFILMRFREELRGGRNIGQATDAAMATSGLAVVLSGLTVIASLTGIYVIDTPVLTSMATGAILAVAMAVLTSITLTPTALAIFGRAAAHRSPFLHWSRHYESSRSRFWTHWVKQVMQRPWLSAFAATTVLLGLAAPSLAMVLGNNMQQQFASSHEIRGGVAAAAEAIGPGALGPVRVLVTFPQGPASSPQHTDTLTAISNTMTSNADIASVSPPIFASHGSAADNNSALISAVLSVDPESLAARAAIAQLRQDLAAVSATTGAHIDIGGPTALIKDFDDRVIHTQPMVFGFVAIIAFIMLLVSIRSPLLALKGVLMTVLSVAAAYGSLVLVFQWGWLANLGFDPITSIDSTIPPLVLAMTFGLSMDYEIFLLTRIRERYLHSGDTQDAVAYGVSTSARTITSAALIMIAVFVGFAFAGMPLVAELGVACAVAIAVDATIVRLVLVPALMAMFDTWNWWLPGWLARILPTVDFEKPLPHHEGDVVVIPDDIAALALPKADLQKVLYRATLFTDAAADTVCVTDPLAFAGCGAGSAPHSGRSTRITREYVMQRVAMLFSPVGSRTTVGHRSAGGNRALGRADRIHHVATPSVHPVTLWCNRLAIALDALTVSAQAHSTYRTHRRSAGRTSASSERNAIERISPIETIAVALPTGDRLDIPTGAETVRLAGYLIMCRNYRADYAELAGLVEVMHPRTVAMALAHIDRYYCGGQSGNAGQQRWLTSQLVRRLADPRPVDGGDEHWAIPSAAAQWERITQRCLLVALAILEETP